MNGGEAVEMDRNEARDLLGAWALDAVDASERTAIEEWLSRDPELRAEAEVLRATASRLAEDSSATPPPELRDRVLQSIAADASGSGLSDDSPGPPGAPTDGHHSGQDHDGGVVPLRARSRRRWWPAVVAAAAAAIAVVAVVVSQPWDAGLTEQDQMVAIEQLLEQQGADSQGGAVAGGGELELAHAPDGEAVVALRDLPALDEDSVYQLWTIQPDADPQSRGLLQVEDGRALTRLQDVADEATVAVTVEPAGGSEAPTTDPLVAVPVA